MEPSSEFAKQCRKDALQKYEDERQKFGLQMMTMGYYKVKSLLSDEGLKKLVAIDGRRQSDEAFNRQFSEKMWKSTEDAWGQVLGQLLIKISDAYGLKMGIDIRVELPQEPDDDSKLDFFA